MYVDDDGLWLELFQCDHKAMGISISLRNSHLIIKKRRWKYGMTKLMNTKLYNNFNFLNFKAREALPINIIM